MADLKMNHSNKNLFLHQKKNNNSLSQGIKNTATFMQYPSRKTSRNSQGGSENFHNLQYNYQKNIIAISSY